MKVKYRFGHYDLPFKDKIVYDKKKMLLICKRAKRFIKRVLKYNINLLWILGIVAIFMVILIPIGINAGKYDSIFDGIWDFRNTILTTFVISFFANTITAEKQRHNTLQKQYYIYYAMEVYTEILVGDLLRTIGYTCDSSIFIDEENKYYFIEQLKEIKEESTLYIPRDMEKKEYITSLIQNYINEISNEINKIDRHDVIGIGEYNPKDLLKSFYDDIFNMRHREELEINAKFIKSYIEKVIDRATSLIAEYRRPWRWDVEIDKKMRKLLKEKAKPGKGFFNALEYYDLPKIRKIGNS